MEIRKKGGRKKPKCLENKRHMGWQDIWQWLCFSWWEQKICLSELSVNCLYRNQAGMGDGVFAVVYTWDDECLYQGLWRYIIETSGGIQWWWKRKTERVSWLQAKGVYIMITLRHWRRVLSLSILDMLGYHELAIWRWPTGRKGLP